MGKVDLLAEVIVVGPQLEVAALLAGDRVVQHGLPRRPAPGAGARSPTRPVRTGHEQPPRSRAGTAGPAGTAGRRSVRRGIPGRVRAAVSPRSDRRAPRLHRPQRVVAAQPPAERRTPGSAVVDAGLDQLPGTELPQPLNRGDRDGQPSGCQLRRIPHPFPRRDQRWLAAGVHRALGRAG